MKLILIALLLPITSFAADPSFTACDKSDPGKQIKVRVNGDDNSIDLAMLNIKVDPKVLGSTTRMPIIMKLAVSRAELSESMIEFYSQNGVKNIVSEMEYAVFPTLPNEDTAPTFLVNVMTLEDNQMGLNVGIQTEGSQSNNDAPIELAFVGSTANCR